MIEAEVDIAVIGGGVIGCAVSQEILKKFPSFSLWLFEEGPRLGEGVTSRNSGVVHAGLYYEPRSLKAELCIEGNSRLYDWAEKHTVPFRRTRKLVVARSSEDVSQLEKLFQNAVASGAKGIRMISKKDALALEPHFPCEAAILSEMTGIIDAAELTKSLAREAESQGAQIVHNCEVQKVDVLPEGGFHLHTTRGTIRAQTVINAAGLRAAAVARLAGIQTYEIYPCRGDYFKIRLKHQPNHLIYPVKRPADPGLGVHLTLDLGGEVRIGPDAEYVSDASDFSPRPEKEAKFREAAIRSLGISEPFELIYDTCGIRPKLRSPKDSSEKDFVISQDLPGWVNLIGIESPGLTASLAIADRVTGEIAG